MKTKNNKTIEVNTMILKVADIKRNNYNPRKTFDKEYIKELAMGILKTGLIHPVTVRPLADGKYELVCGECRLRAHKLAKISKIRAEVRNLSDKEALQIALFENINRKDITIIEEAQTFTKLLEMGGNNINDLILYSGRSETYVRDRLKLLDLIPELQNILENGMINLGQALALARFSKKIQEEVYQNHFTEAAEYAKWFNMKGEQLLQVIENSYTTKLENYCFDKAECMTCPHNTKQFLLFEGEGCGKCANKSCLDEKNASYVLEKALHLKKAFPNLIFNRYYYTTNETVIERLNILGHEVDQIRGIRYCKPQPCIPLSEEYSNEDKYRQALKIYQSEIEEVNQQIAELKAAEERNEIQFIANIERNNVSLCYIEIAMADENSNPTEAKLNELEGKFKRNQELETEHVIEDIQKLLSASDISVNEFREQEEKILYYFMLTAVSKKHFALFGEKYKNEHILSEEARAKIVRNLNEEMKTVIRRDYIISKLPKMRYNDADTQMLYDFANVHFPAAFADITANRKRMYQKKNEVLQQQITTLSRETEPEPETVIFPIIDTPEPLLLTA